MSNKTRIKVLEKELKWLDRFYKNELKNRDQNLILQAEKTEERLQRLNGEYARIDKVLNDSMPREVYGRDMAEQNKINETFKLELLNLTNELKGKITPRGLWTAVVSGATVAGIIFTILMNIF